MVHPLQLTLTLTLTTIMMALSAEASSSVSVAGYDSWAVTLMCATMLIEFAVIMVMTVEIICLRKHLQAERRKRLPARPNCYTNDINTCQTTTNSNQMRGENSTSVKLATIKRQLGIQQKQVDGSASGQRSKSGTVTEEYVYASEMKRAAEQEEAEYDNDVVEQQQQQQMASSSEYVDILDQR